MNRDSPAGYSADLVHVFIILMGMLAVLCASPARAADALPVTVDLTRVDLIPHTRSLTDSRPAAAWAEVLTEDRWTPLPESGSMGRLDGPAWFRVDVDAEQPRVAMLRFNEFSLTELALVHVVDGRVAASRTYRADQPIQVRDVADPLLHLSSPAPTGPLDPAATGDGHRAGRSAAHTPVRSSPERALARQHLAWAAYLGLIVAWGRTTCSWG